MKILRKVFFVFNILLLSLVILIIACDQYIESYSDLTYDASQVDELSRNQLALLPGTSKYYTKNNLNKYYIYRINAAVELYEAGVINHILISGYSKSKFYNEPDTFKEDLVKRGVDPADITLDNAGLRTFDSVVRAKTVFNKTKFIIISQEFQNLRALFIADAFDIDAIAYNAKSMSVNSDLKTYLREKLARVKAVLDVYVLNTKPVYSGKQNGTIE